MIISELIEALIEEKELIGDIEVSIEDMESPSGFRTVKQCEYDAHGPTLILIGEN